MIYTDLKLTNEVEPELINEDLVTKLAKARIESMKQLTRNNMLIATMVAYLLLAQFGYIPKFTVSGLKLESIIGLSEILIVIVAILSSAIIARTTTLITLTTALKTSIPIVYQYKLSYLQSAMIFINEIHPYFIPLNMPHITQTRATRIAQWLMILIMLIALISIVIISITWRFLVYTYLWQNPISPDYWTYAAVIIALTIDSFSIIIMLIYLIPLPHRDYSALHTIEIAELHDKEAVSRAYKQIYGDDWKDEDEMRRKGYIKSKNDTEPSKKSANVTPADD